MDFDTYTHRAAIEQALKAFLPSVISAEWADKVVGLARWKQDTTALTKAVSEPVWDFLIRGGKRWRPMLMCICCEAVGGKAKEIIPFTVIPELIHNGTLITDDIEDNSELRRGKLVLHKLFGTGVALNAGETLYLLPFTVIRDSSLPADTKRKAYEIISTQLLKCFFGQAIDISWGAQQSSRLPTEEEYLQMCANKSGSLACMAAKLGALLGNGTMQHIEALGKFGETAGVVFQIQDDILNISENRAIGKDFGDDITEGKRTLLVMHTLHVAPEQESRRLLEILGMHTRDTRLMQEAIAIITKHGSIEYAKKVASQLAEQAWREIDTLLPASDAKNHLRDLAQLLINRVV
jgi:geranylgeranyl pyrophosphate synthase